MTPLRRKALASSPLSEATVETFYARNNSTLAGDRLKMLCISHERLRAELQGAEVLVEESRADAARLRARIAAALALTDTGSAEFAAKFTPHTAVAGWRIIEAIRAALLTP